MKTTFVFLTVLFQLGNSLAQEGWFWQNPLPQGNALCDIIAFDENWAIAVGDKGTSIATSDGGETWRVFHDRDKETGFVLKTSDGGMSWSRQDIPAILNSVHFVNDEIGYVAGENGIILKSVDGGTGWLLQNGQTTFATICLLCRSKYGLDSWSGQQQ